MTAPDAPTPDLQPAEAAPPGARFRRTHPLTPLVSGWKLLAGLVAVITAQNLGELMDGFTWQRALLVGGLVLGALVLTIALSAAAWWRTTYAITPDGVEMHSGLLTRTRRTAPAERIESVSIERPFIARLVGLSTVRIEMAGGSDSHLDLNFVTSREAETIRREILGATEPDPSHAGNGPEVPDAPEAAANATRRERLAAALHDGVTDGRLIAEIPTSRLIASMLRDVSLVLTVVLMLVWVIATLVVSVVTDDIGVGAIFALLPVAFAVPRLLFSRIEAGWGFVSRLTPRGLRMRRGLMSTRTDAIGAGRVQDLSVSQPILWRGPAWYAAEATVAGRGADIGDDDKGGEVLPVGTTDELALTLSAMLPPLGTEDDLGTVRALLAARARDIDGMRPAARLLWIGRRTRAAVLLPGALAVRTGILTRTIQLVPRERIQGLELSQGPIQRRIGHASLTVAVAAGSADVADLPLADALALRDALEADAARGRRYRDKDAWPRPVLEADGASDEGPAGPGPAAGPTDVPVPA
ncbi:PH domain-containing protein [Brachybacterium huguangmaarense]